MGEYGALGFAGGAAGVLKQCDIIDVHNRPFARQLRCTICAQLAETQNGASAAMGVVGMADGPKAVSSPTMRWSTRPSVLNFWAISAMKPMLVETRIRAPEFWSLKASSRSASSGERCTMRAPHLRAAKNAMGW